MSVDAEPDADAEADVLPESDTAFDADTEADLAHEVDADIDADTEADLAPDVLDATVDSASDSDASTKPPGPVHFEQPASGAQWQAGSTHVIRLVIDPELEATFPGATWLAIAEVSIDGGAFVALDEGIAHAAGWERVIRWTVTAPTGSELRVRAQISARDPAGNPLEVGGLEVPSAVVRLAPSGLRACYAWSLVTSEAAFAPRDGAGALVKDGRMWLIGGWNPLDPEHFPEITVNDVWSSADGRAWRNDVPNAAPGMWERRHKAGYAVFDDALWILGGDLSTGHMQPDVWRSADGVAWTQVSAQTPWGERVLQMVWVHAGAMWVMGGQTLPQFGAPAESVIYNDVWRSTDGAQWQRVLEHAPWSPRGMMGGEAVHRGPHVDPRRRHLRHARGASASLRERRLVQCRRDRVAPRPRRGAVGRAPVPRGRRLGRAHVRPGRLRRGRQSEGRLVLGRRGQLVRARQHPMGAATRVEHLRP